MHKTHKRLADGSRRAYYYAWKGGPKVEGAYGSAEFARRFREAVETRKQSIARTGTLQSLLDRYQRSRGMAGSGKGFLDLGARTQAVKHIRAIEREFGTMPLEAAPRRSPLILTSTRGVPWTEDGFRASFSKARGRAKITDRTFNDLRGTAVTRLAIVGCTVPEIAAITGHSHAEINTILEKHYLARDPRIAASAIRKLESGAQNTAKKKVNTDQDRKA